MIKLNCPSCGGSLELPDNIGVAHCMYCGTKILLQENELQKERQNLERYKELGKVAIQAKNYDEAILYCNKVLEIDPKDIDAWIDKAVSTFWLSTGANNRYMEAIEYLEKAGDIAPEDTRIAETIEEITQLQARWLNSLGIDALKNANEIYRIYDSGGVQSFDLDGLRYKAQDVANAKRESAENYIEAMNYFLAASGYSPSDTAILSNIATCAKTAHWISWNTPVKQKIQSLQLLNAKQNAKGKLPLLRKNLVMAQEKLNKHKAEKGFLSSFKVNDAANKVRQLQAEITKLEKYASYQPPNTR